MLPTRSALICVVLPQLAATIMALSCRHCGTIGTSLRNLDVMTLSEIDAAFHTIFGKFRSSTIKIATNTQEYKDALALYCQSCVASVKDGIARLPQASPHTPASFIEDLKHALAWPVDSRAPIPYPFPTRSFVAWIFDLFASISNAIDEVRFPFY